MIKRTTDECIQEAIYRGQMIVDTDKGIPYSVRCQQPYRLSLTRKGYVTFQITLDGHHTIVYLHRVVWIAEYGYIHPDMEIDHRDRNKQNNCIFNLREVTRSENLRNRRRWKRRK